MSEDILSLKRFIGYSPIRILWIDNDHIVYPSSSSLIIHTISNGFQHLLPQKHFSPISATAFSKFANVIVSASSELKTQNNSRIPSSSSLKVISMICLWDAATHAHLESFHIPIATINTVDITEDGKYIIISGLDDYNRNELCLVNSNITSSSFFSLSDPSTSSSVLPSLSILGKTKTQTDVIQAKFIPNSSFLNCSEIRFLTCGKRNVKYWRLRNNSLMVYLIFFLKKNF
jgi:hypothetical protein